MYKIKEYMVHFFIVKMKNVYDYTANMLKLFLSENCERSRLRAENIGRDYVARTPEQIVFVLNLL